MAGCWAFHYSSPGWVCENLKSERSIKSVPPCGSGRLNSKFTLLKAKINHLLPQAVLTALPCLFQRPFVIVANSNHPGKFEVYWRSLQGIRLYRKDYLWETIETIATIFRRG